MVNSFTFSRQNDMPLHMILILCHCCSTKREITRSGLLLTTSWWLTIHVLLLFIWFVMLSCVSYVFWCYTSYWYDSVLILCQINEHYGSTVISERDDQCICCLLLWCIFELLMFPNTWVIVVLGQCCFEKHNAACKGINWKIVLCTLKMFCQWDYYYVLSCK